MNATFWLLAKDSSCSTPFGPGGPGLYDHLCSGGSVQIDSLSDITTIIVNVIRILLAVAGVLAVVFIIIGGIMFIISRGDPSNINRARGIITNAIVGTVVILLAYAIVTFIGGQL